MIMNLFAGIAVAVVLLSAIPEPARALDLDDARHFLMRTGFGATTGDVQRLAPLNRAQAVDAALAGVRREAVTPPPAFMADAHPDWPAQWRSKDEEQKSVFNRERDREAVELKAWWWRGSFAPATIRSPR